MKLDYKQAGVNKEEGYAEVALIKELVKKTHHPNVLSSIGGFSGLYELPTGYEKPVLVSGTDGVGTKLKLAFMMDQHHTVGQDCVAMCINDILCQGAKPLYFLDYIATGKLEAEKMAQVVEGVVEGCVQADAALIGGETAEMPGFYPSGEYDMAGFAVGVVEKDRIIDGRNIQEGDVIYAIASSGVHSNGFSLIRKIVFEKMNFSVDAPIEELGTTIGEELLKPTRIYARIMEAINQELEVHGYIHITGGGLYENIPRIMPEGLCASIQLQNYRIPTIFSLLAKWGEIDPVEMFGTFNMGLGMIVILSKEDEEKLIEILNKSNETIHKIGEVVNGSEKLCLDID